MPATEFYFDDVIGGAVVAQQAYAARLKQQWAAKIHNSTPRELQDYLVQLCPKPEWRQCLELIHDRLDPALDKLREVGLWPVNPEDRYWVTTIRQKLCEANNFGLSELERALKVKAHGLGSDDILELLRITVMIAILRQLQRQMMGLIG